MKTFYSQHGEDIYTYKNFINKKTNDGVFVEIGGMDGLWYSNSKFFEDELCFKGVLIEPVIGQYVNLIKNRPNCDCYNLAVNHTHGKVKFIGTHATAGLVHTMADSFRQQLHPYSHEYYVDGCPFGDILQKSDIKYIDLLTIDVEGGEQIVLETMNWNIEVYVIVIELDGRNPQKDEKCREILASKGFTFNKKIGINEFWINPNYSRKNVVWDPTANADFSNIVKHANFVWLQTSSKPEVMKSLQIESDSF